MKIPVYYLAFLFFVAVPLFKTAAQAPLNWTRDEVNPGEDFTLIPDASKFTEGTKSCQMQLNSGAVPYLVSDFYYVTPGAAYEFSFDVLDNDTAGQVKVYADFYDTYGFDVFGQPPVFSADSSEWQTMVWSGIVPSQAVVGYTLVKFYNQPDLYNFTRKSYTWIDNFRFVEEGGSNLILNGGFEEWLVGIEEEPDRQGSLSAYPNPAVNQLNIDIPEQSGTLVISDLTGKEMTRFYTGDKFTKQIKIDVCHYPPGMYIIHYYLPDGSGMTGKFVRK